MEGGEKGYMRDGAREGQGPGTANTIARGWRERSKWSLRRVGWTRGESKQATRAGEGQRRTRTLNRRTLLESVWATVGTSRRKEVEREERIGLKPHGNMKL